MLGLPHISAKSCYPLAYHSSQPRVATLWPTTVSVTTTLDLPSINYRVLIIPKHPHYIHIITCLFQNIFLSTHTTFIFINNSISINTFQFQQHPFIITIPNSITYNSITYIFTNKFYNHKCNQTQQYINLSSQGSSVSRILTLTALDSWLKYHSCSSYLELAVGKQLKSPLYVPANIYDIRLSYWTYTLWHINYPCAHTSHHPHLKLVRYWIKPWF